MNRDEKSKKKPRNMDQSLIHEAEYGYLLKILEKNLEIPEDCTYADHKMIDIEVSPGNNAVLRVTRPPSLPSRSDRAAVKPEPSLPG